MNHFVRIFFSGIFGLLIVLALFLLMLRLLSHDSPSSESSMTSVELVTYIPPNSQQQKLQPIKITKKQRNKPLQQQAPDLDLTETSHIESGSGEQFTASSMGEELGQVSASHDGYMNGSSDLNTGYMAKYYEHSLNFPSKAIKAGITDGQLIVKVAFSKNHEFLKFEILQESPVDYFRDVLYQLKFIRAEYGHLYHPEYNVQKRIPNDAKEIHYETYQFIFDHNSSEPIKMYINASN